MALINAELTHPDFGFTIKDVSGNNQMKIDIPVEQGGHGQGMRPMQTVLSALTGCSGVDVVMILKKQKQEYTSMKILVDGEREKGKEPSLWETVHIQFVFEGTVDAAKAYRAAELSVNKYCSVAETLRRGGTKISFDVTVNGVKFRLNGQ
ncbi:MAG: OsmC family protein [Sphingobacteriales bacterium]|nr:OsmC family protein [Sphingobacteriales bacterium]MBI3719106.1 OsmC family protein [Sphingobacteriales bacterium]